jgi:aminoglycoside phosphotransferase (APT) family kinase protein
MSSPYPPAAAAIRPGNELDWSPLADNLAAQIDGLGTLKAMHQFPNGLANLTYRLDFARRRHHRPPFGHDRRRSDDGALSRLCRSHDRPPPAYLLCDNHSVIGAHFLVIEYREGQIICGSGPPAMRRHDNVAQRIAFAVIEALAATHQIDLQQAGLADLGRPAGFVDRQLAGWRSRCTLSTTGICRDSLTTSARLTRARASCRWPGAR